MQKTLITPVMIALVLFMAGILSPSDSYAAPVNSRADFIQNHPIEMSLREGEFEPGMITCRIANTPGNQGYCSPEDESCKRTIHWIYFSTTVDECGDAGGTVVGS
ncbi:MAG: hypothetical protein HRT35_00635 [Algicola sp.]|nr:hypothetical protein [Algicola sp.]